jgi:exosortase A-associated hydrolase 2
VLLWQPVLKGEIWLSQFLRLRTAAAMFRGGEKETVKDLQGRLLAGEVAEVAGYRVGPALARGLLGCSLNDELAMAGRSVAWLEVTSGEGRELPPASARTTDALTRGGVPVRAAVVGGEPFWSTQEIAVAPELIRATLEFL